MSFVLVKNRKIKIFPAKRKHRSEIKVINEKCLPENYDDFFWDTFVSYGNSFVLCAGNFVIGYCLCSEKANIASFAVLPEYRGKGYGKQLLKTTLDYLKTRYNESSLQVRVSNKLAIQLYTSLGFVVNKTLENYYQSPIREDAYEMINKLKI